MLFVTNLLPPAGPGGYEVICGDYAGELRRRGHEVFVLTTTLHKDRAPAREDFVFRRLQLGYDMVLLEPDNDNAELKRFNLRVMSETLADVKPEIVVAWHCGHLGSGILNAAERGYPVVYYLANLWLTWGGGRRVRHVKRLLSTAIHRTETGRPTRRQNGLMVFCSHALLDEYTDANFNTRAAVVNYPGVPMELFASERVRSAAGARTILFSGRIVPEKGVHTLLRAFQLLQLRGFSDVRLRLCGVVQGREHRRIVQSILSDPRLLESVELLPPRQRVEMPAVYAEADIAVFPSEWNEPFGLSLVEAMACGLPVVTTTMGGPGEIARDGETAVTFRAGDSADLAEKLQWVLEHPTDAAMLGRAASEDVRRRFDLHQQVAEFEHLVASITS